MTPSVYTLGRAPEDYVSREDRRTSVVAARYGLSGILMHSYPAPSVMAPYQLSFTFLSRESVSSSFRDARNLLFRVAVRGRASYRPATLRALPLLLFIFGPTTWRETAARSDGHWFTSSRLPSSERLHRGADSQANAGHRMGRPVG